MGNGYDHDWLDDHLTALGQELTTSVLQGGTGFCGVNVQEYAINGTTYFWRKGSKLKIALDFDDLGQLTSSQVKEAIEAAINEVRATTDGLLFELFTPTLSANLVCKLARLDGPNGVLADCGIPPVNADPGSTQLQMRIDTGEVWRLFDQQVSGAIDFLRVFLHEFEHFLGLGHKPASIAKPALIAPIYSPIIRGLQEADKEEIVRRYGGKTTPVQPPVTPPSIPAGDVKGTMTVEIGGQKWSASGLLKLQQGIYSDRYPTGPVEVPEVWDTDLYHEGDSQ